MEGNLESDASEPVPEESKAYHEAGHAVLVALQGHFLMRASIEPDGEVEGRVLCAPRGSLPKPRNARLANPEHRLLVPNYIEILLAGSAAQAVWYCGTGANLDNLLECFDHAAAGQPDLKIAVAYAKAISYTDEDAKALLKWLRARVIGRFVRNGKVWHLVRVVAQALLEHKTIDGWHIYWMMRRALRGFEYEDDIRQRLIGRIARRAGSYGWATKRMLKLGL